MNKHLFALTLCVAILSSSGCAHRASRSSTYTSSTEAYFGDKKVSRYIYANGLKLLVLRDDSSPTFAYQTWFNVGSRDEDVGLTGIAHLFEHMMFRGTSTYKDQQFDRILESAGVEGENAFTNRDYTAYVQSLPKDKLELIMTLESDRMVNLIVDDATLDKEREVVKNERRFRRENSPDGTMFEKIYEVAFTKHSYHWPVIGYAADLDNAKAKQCAEFYKSHYAPNNATIVVVGDVEPSRVAELVQKYYGSILPAEVKAKKIETEPKQTQERKVELNLPIPVEKLVFAYKIPNTFDADVPAIAVVRSLLGAGKSSRLYRKLVDKGIATDVGVDDDFAKDPSLALFFVNLQKGKKATSVLPVVDKEVRDLAEGHVDQAELERALSVIRFNFFDGQGSNHAKATFLGHGETVSGDMSRDIKFMEDIKHVNRDDIMRVAKKYFMRESRTVVIGHPAKGGAK